MKDSLFKGFSINSIHWPINHITNRLRANIRNMNISQGRKLINFINKKFN